MEQNKQSKLYKILLVIGGFVNIGMAIFHVTFWINTDFNWQEELPKLNFINQGLMNTFNIIMIYLILCFAGISFLIFKETSSGLLEKFILFIIGGFYSLRGILQFPLFGISMIGIIVIAICALIAGCYFIALAISIKWNKNNSFQIG